MRRRRLVVAAGAILVTAACSLVGVDGLSGGGEPEAPPSAAGALNDAAASGDGAAAVSPGDPRDAGGPVDDPCAPTPGNLLAGQNEGMEDGCALWSPSRVTTAATTTRRCGKAACRVCPHYDDDLAGKMTLAPAASTLARGERYVLTAWLRRETGATNATAKVALGGDQSSGTRGSTPLMTDWGKSVAVYDVVDGDSSTTIWLSLLPNKTGGTGECVVIDDVSLVRVKDAGP